MKASYNHEESLIFFTSFGYLSSPPRGLKYSLFHGKWKDLLFWWLKVNYPICKQWAERGKCVQDLTGTRSQPTDFLNRAGITYYLQIFWHNCHYSSDLKCNPLCNMELYMSSVISIMISLYTTYNVIFVVHTLPVLISSSAFFFERWALNLVLDRGDIDMIPFTTSEMFLSENTYWGWAGVGRNLALTLW